jgi:anti-sigma-K factor RskA
MAEHPEPGQEHRGWERSLGVWMIPADDQGRSFGGVRPVRPAMGGQGPVGDRTPPETDTRPEPGLRI